MDPMAVNMPHVKAAWKEQAGCLIAFATCPGCGVNFGLSGEPDYLASGEAKHWCRVCHVLLRVTACGLKPDVPPRWSQYQAEMASLTDDQATHEV